MTKRSAIDSSSQSIGELLRKPFCYKVPFYQRDYAWSKDEVDALWDDLINALENGQGEYFLGAIVLSQTNDDKAREIVDGQQRLATLTMVFSSIVDLWREYNDEKRANGVSHDYLGAEDRRTGDIVPKLSLNETNDSVFQELIVKSLEISDNTKKSWPESNKLIDVAFQRIRDKLQKWVTGFSDIESALLDIEEFISTQVHLIVIEVGDDSEAFIIFETLNDRGLDLAVSDLVKNYLFSLSGSHLDKFKTAWREISVLVGGHNLTQFLRYFWLSEYDFVREKELYKELRNLIKSNTKARQFIEKLRKSADLYAALMNPEHVYWSDFPQEVRAYLEPLLLFKVTQFRPIALAAMEKHQPSIVCKILKMLMVVSFRYTLVSGQTPSTLEKIYSNAALSIRKDEASKPKEIFKILKPVYIDDSRFVDDFCNKNFSKASIARYILSEVNDYLENDPEKKVAERSGKITLEHILPRNINQNWKDVVPKGTDIIDVVEKIGNLTLLEKGKNRGIASAGFSTKKDKAFLSSSLAINNDLTSKNEWRINDILDRSKEFAKVANKIWRLDY